MLARMQAVCLLQTVAMQTKEKDKLQILASLLCQQNQSADDTLVFFCSLTSRRNSNYTLRDSSNSCSKTGTGPVSNLPCFRLAKRCRRKKKWCGCAKAPSLSDCERWKFVAETTYHCFVLVCAQEQWFHCCTVVVQPFAQYSHPHRLTRRTAATEGCNPRALHSGWISFTSFCTVCSGCSVQLSGISRHLSLSPSELSQCDVVRPVTMLGKLPHWLLFPVVPGVLDKPSLNIS